MMPIFDQWGLVPDCHDGPHGNPLTVVLDPSDSDSDEDSGESTEEDDDGWALPRSHHKLLCDFGDDAADEQP